MTDVLRNEFHGPADRERLERIAASRTSDPAVLDGILTSSIGGGKIKHRILRGEANEVYDIDTSSGEAILRISRRRHNPFEAELWCLDQARQQDVPVPETMAAGDYAAESRKLYYMIQKKIEGELFDHMLWVDKIDPARARAITEQIGEIMAKIHRVKPDGWGDILPKGQCEFRTLEERFANMTARSDEFSKALAPFAGLDIPSIEEILTFIEERYPLSEGKQCLTHNDVGPKHIFVKDDKVIGLIDFEDAQSADPLQEFANWDFWFRDMVPTDWLRAGYERVGSLGDNQDERMRYLRVQNSLWLLNYYSSNEPDNRYAEKAALSIKEAMGV